MDGLVANPILLAVIGRNHPARDEGQQTGLDEQRTRQHIVGGK